MTVTDNTVRSISQSIGEFGNSFVKPMSTMPDLDYSNYRPYSTATNYDYPSNYPIYSHSSPLFSTGSKSYYPSSMDSMSNLNQFYSHPGKTTIIRFLFSLSLAAADSSSIYSSSNSNSNPFNYSPGLFFGWNNDSSALMRTPSTSYPTYPGSRRRITFIWSSINAFVVDPYSISQEKSRPSNPIYPSYFPPIPPTNYSLLPPPPPPPLPLPPTSSTNRTVSQSASTSQRLMPSKINKRPRLTAPIRREILKLKGSQPSLFIWEIQQKLLQNGICTSQTLPTVNFFLSEFLFWIFLLSACRYSTCS